MFGFWKKAYFEDVENLANNLAIIKSEVAKFESTLGAYKIENEALKEQITNLKKEIDEKDNIIENLARIYDRFHKDFIDICADNFPVFPHDKA